MMSELIDETIACYNIYGDKCWKTLQTLEYVDIKNWT